MDGVHDLTFVGKDSHDILDWKSFELSDKLFFSLAVEYKVDDDSNNAKDVQCTYEVVKKAYKEQVFDRYYYLGTSSADAQFYADFGVSNEAEARQAVYDMCGAAQASIEQM